MKTLFRLLFGCAHTRTTFPIKPGPGSEKRSYVCCLDCEREFQYDWKQMRVMSK